MNTKTRPIYHILFTIAQINRKHQWWFHMRFPITPKNRPNWKNWGNTEIRAFPLVQYYSKAKAKYKKKKPEKYFVSCFVLFKKNLLSNCSPKSCTANMFIEINLCFKQFPTFKSGQTRNGHFPFNLFTVQTLTKVNKNPAHRRH